MTDYRYPYTYAADFIRACALVSGGGVVLSRSNASKIRKAIAEAIGMDDRELSEKLADAQIEELFEQVIEEMHPQQQEES